MLSKTRIGQTVLSNVPNDNIPYDTELNPQPLKPNGFCTESKEYSIIILKQRGSDTNCKSRKIRFMILELSNQNQSAEYNDSNMSLSKNTQEQDEEHLRICEEHSRT